jgi:hypothetical protein
MHKENWVEDLNLQGRDHLAEISTNKVISEPKHQDWRQSSIWEKDIKMNLKEIVGM